MSKRQVLLNVIRYFTQKSPKHKIVGEYRRATDKDGSMCVEFLITNRRRIVKYHSFATFKEFALNYRILFNRKNKKKIIHDFKKYILTKNKKHKSNLAMSYNMINAIAVDETLEQEIIDFMYRQLDDPKATVYSNQPYFFKKHFIMDYVKTNVITKEPV